VKKLSAIKILLSIIVLGILIILLGCTSSPSSTPAPAPAPSPPPTTTPSSSQTTVTINLTAQGMAFDRKTISVSAGADVTVIFENKDKVPHNLAVYTDKSAAKGIFVGEVITGPKTITYRFTAPTNPGTYFFRCDVHPATMIGDFIVTNAGS
jgi:plastocyanin